MDLAAYLINLDRDPDRLAHMEREFARARIAFSRVPGVLGLELPDWVRPYFLTGDGVVASPVKPGEIGCYASHLTAARRLLDDGSGYALICEDDLELPSALSCLIEEVVAVLPVGWDMLRLSNPPKAPWRTLVTLSHGRELVLYSRVPNNTGAYLLSRSGARKLLAPGLRRMPVDEHLRRPWLLSIETYGIVPAPIVSNIFGSTIDAVGDRGFSHDRSVAKRRRREFGNLASWGTELRWQVRHLGLMGYLIAILKRHWHSVRRRISGR